MNCIGSISYNFDPTPGYENHDPAKFVLMGIKWDICRLLPEKRHNRSQDTNPWDQYLIFWPCHGIHKHLRFKVPGEKKKHEAVISSHRWDKPPLASPWEENPQPCPQSHPIYCIKWDGFRLLPANVSKEERETQALGDFDGTCYLVLLTQHRNQTSFSTPG